MSSEQKGWLSKDLLPKLRPRGRSLKNKPGSRSSFRPSDVTLISGRARLGAPGKAALRRLSAAPRTGDLKAACSRRPNQASYSLFLNRCQEFFAPAGNFFLPPGASILSNFLKIAPNARLFNIKRAFLKDFWRKTNFTS